MPTLNWIGKEAVIKHHRDVPTRLLEPVPELSCGDANSGNLIVQGDNLHALKALLPRYAGQVKCIYIDPPYNTGNESWVYNDNVNDPKINKWLGQVVGREAEDLTRHDKWLCMMYPRLKLLHKLLSEDGIIFISIDDSEINNLKLICDEIFGSRNFITSLVWRRRTSSQLSQNNVSVDHEYVVSYFKNNYTVFNGTKKDYKNYSNPDNDPKGLWTLGDLTVGMTKDQRPNQFYDLVDPNTGIAYKPSEKRVWTYFPETMDEKIKAGQVVFPKSEKGKPMYKRYLCDLRTDINPLSSWLSNDAYGIGLNSEGTKIIQSIFDRKVFDYPKPISLLTTIISQASSGNDIILDSFAGSGTTAHAVLNLNKQDGGNRKFILVEMEDYAETITAERVKRVMKRMSESELKNEQNSLYLDNQTNTNLAFDYYELGEPLFLEDGNLNESVGIVKIRSYIWYTETQQSLNHDLFDLHDKDDLKINTNKDKQTNHQNYSLDSFLGKHNDTAYYFHYLKDEVTTLNHAFLSTMKTKAEQYVIYADNCVLTKAFMTKHHIIFKKIPRDITRF